MTTDGPDTGDTTSRRRFLTGAGALLAVPLLGAAGPLRGPAGRGFASGPGPALPPGLFSLGVASGDPEHNRVLLWTRLAPEPLAGGGMPDVDVPVHWEISADDSFRRIVRRGTAVATPGHAHSVHVDVVGLRPDAWYHYRFLAGDEVSPVGRARTAPPPGRGDHLRFLFASCQNWQQGFYPAWGHAVDEDADLVVHLGDYIYEGGQGGTSVVRLHDGPEVTTLDAYRNRYGLYKSDPALQAIHAACPFVVTWDDHEVDNNYAGLVPENPSEAASFAARRAAAYQAWWEHQPVRLPPPVGPDLRIHRAVDWGRLARFHVLDGRQHRSEQPCGTAGDLGPTCPERTAADRTMLGAEQEAWVGESLRRSHAHWDVIANQVVMTSMPLAGSIYNLDQWDGYAADRTRLYDQIRAAAVENAVVVTGDIHAAGVGDLVDELPDGTPTTDAVGTELVGTAISSSFPPELGPVAQQLIEALAHIHWADTTHRGYTRCDVDGDQLVAQYRQVSSVLSPEATIATGATFTIESGSPGAHQH
jgi:alkaline phosphatase D